MRTFLQALSLLTRLPVRVTWDDAPPPGRMMAWYPVVGLVIGLLLMLPVAAFRFGPLTGTALLLGAALTLTAWAALTGALHLDGWSDYCDAMFVHATPEKRLQIMADPRLGSFGSAGLTLLLLVKGAALHAVMTGITRAHWEGLILLGATPVLARAMIVLACRRFPLAKPDGMAAYFQRGLTRRDTATALGLAVLAAAGGGWCGLVCLGVAVLTAALVGHLAVRRIGGITGDVLGATVEAVETAVLTTIGMLTGMTAA
jgi:adenosylcobinamide-GDP ribazoletransferase